LLQRRRCRHFSGDAAFFVLFVSIRRQSDGKLFCCYLPATLFHRVLPSIKVNAKKAIATRQAATSISTNHVFLSIAKSINCQACWRYGVFAPTDGFSSARFKWRSSFKTTIVCGLEMRIPSTVKRFAACSRKSHLNVTAAKASAHQTSSESTTPEAPNCVCGQPDFLQRRFELWLKDTASLIFWILRAGARVWDRSELKSAD